MIWLKFIVAALAGALLTVAVVKLTADAPTAPPARAVTAPVAPADEPPAPSDPDPARRAVISALGKAGVPSRAVRHGVYPLLGARRAADETLPLVSFDCPIGRDCGAVLAAVEQAATDAGFTMAPAKRADVDGRPRYRALAKGNRPALAVRAMPGGPRLSLVVDDLGADSALAERLLALPEHVTFAVNPDLAQGQALIQRLSAAGREVLAHVPMEPIDPSQAGSADLTTSMPPADVGAQVGRLMRGVVGISADRGGRLTTSGPHVSAMLAAVAEHGGFFFDPLESPASLVAATAKTLGVRTATRTHTLTGGPDLASQLRAVEAALVLDGRAIAVADPAPETLAAIAPWLAALGKRRIHLLRLSEVVR